MSSTPEGAAAPPPRDEGNPVPAPYTNLRLDALAEPAHSGRGTAGAVLSHSIGLDVPSPVTVPAADAPPIRIEPAP